MPPVRTVWSLWQTPQAWTFSRIAYARLKHRHLFDLERLVFASDDGCLEGLRDVGGGAHVGNGDKT
jgi:hypothetical protein